MKHYERDYCGHLSEEGGCMAGFVTYPYIKGVDDTYEEVEADAYEQLENHLKKEGERDDRDI